MVGWRSPASRASSLDRASCAARGPSYTLDTLRELHAARAAAPSWFLIMGADQFAALHTWHDWESCIGSW